MDVRLFVLHTSSYLYLVLAYMAAQGAFSWLAPMVPGGRTGLNLLYMMFASSGMLAFGFLHRWSAARGRLLALLFVNGAARAAMELLPGGAARTVSAVLFLLGCGWLLGLVLYMTARRVPRDRLGQFVGGSMALATGLMFLLSLARDFLPLTPLASAAAFGAMVWLLWTDCARPCGERPLAPSSRTVERLPLFVGVALLLSLAYGINDSISYLRFEEFRDAFGLSRLALGVGFLAAGRLADRRRAYLPLAALLASAATMAFHAMALEGFPVALLFCANEFFWSFSFLFILLLFMEASLRTQRPELWAGMGRLIEMPAEGLGAALGTALLATLPTSAVLVAYTLTLAAATGLLYRGLLSYAETMRATVLPFSLPSARLRSTAEASEAVDAEVAREQAVCEAAEEDAAGETEETEPPSPESLLAEWRARYALTNRETEILRASLSDDTVPTIGKALFITTSTVRYHLTHLLKKTGFSTRKDMANAFTRELDRE